MSAEFDAVADDYRQQHASSIRLSGEEPDFFARYKIEATADAMAMLGLMPRRILDFGAGVGNSLPHLQEIFPQSEVTCLDVSARSLELCRERALRPVEVLHSDGRIIAAQDASFDLVFTACVFHHIDPATHVTHLREIRRVLAPAGRLVLFEHNPWNPLTQHAVRTCEFDRDAILISAPEMRRRFRAAGFADVSVDYRMFFPAALAALRPLERGLHWLPLGAQYSIIAA
jgi:SAM-dependent methyltransferase